MSELAIDPHTGWRIFVWFTTALAVVWTAGVIYLMIKDFRDDE